MTSLLHKLAVATLVVLGVIASIFIALGMVLNPSFQTSHTWPKDVQNAYDWYMYVLYVGTAVSFLMLLNLCYDNRDQTRRELALYLLVCGIVNMLVSWLYIAVSNSHGPHAPLDVWFFSTIPFVCWTVAALLRFKQDTPLLVNEEDPATEPLLPQPHVIGLNDLENGTVPTLQDPASPAEDSPAEI